MLKILRTAWFINTVLISLTIGLSLMTVHWHHQMFELYGEELKVNKKNEEIIALNKQLLMERSELISGVSVYEQAQQELQMKSPEENAKTLDL